MQNNLSDLQSLLERLKGATGPDLLRLAFPPDLTECPRWARRAFVALLPVTGPLWVLWAVAGFLAVCIGCVVGAFGFLAVWALAWAVSPAFYLWEWAYDLWSTPDDLQALIASKSPSETD